MRCLNVFLFLSIFLLTIAEKLCGQVFGGNRPGMHWYQIKTDSLSVIFPKVLETQAKDIIKSGHWILQNQNPLGKKHKSIDIILQNQTTISNGYVGIAPRRSEYFMMPELSNIELTSIPWHLQLTLHEMRHLSQFNNFNTGIAKALGIFMGEQGQALAMNAVIPNWFWEGDAVQQETDFTGQGRGRLPIFFNGFRSLWMENKKYSFHKLRNGSLKHFIPDHYQLGYLLVNYGVNKYGTDFWRHVTHNALKIKSPFYSFQHTIKKQTGLPYKKFINNAFAFYQDSFRLNENINPKINLLSKSERNNVINYEYPILKDDGSVLALMSSYRDVPRWVNIDAKGNIHSLRIKDISQQSYYTYRNGSVVYSAYQIHPRWGWENYSIIKIWDIEADTLKQLTYKSRLFQPDLSADKSRVVAVHSGLDMKSSLTIIDVNTRRLSTIPNPNDYIYTYPRFTNKGDSIVTAVRNKIGEMGILKIDTATGNSDTMLHFINVPLAYLQVVDKQIFFTASYYEKDLLFMLKEDSSQLYKIKELPNGVYQSSIHTDKNILLWITQNADGFQIGKDTLSNIPWQPIDKPQLHYLYSGYHGITDYMDRHSLLAERKDTVRRYRRLAHLLYPHSWRPIIYEPDYGFQIFSDNIMNTLSSEVNYNYNRNEQSHTAGFNIIYGGLFPQLYTGVSNSWNRSFYDANNNLIQWDESSIKTGFLIPFTFVPGKTFHRLELNSSWQWDEIRYKGDASKILDNEYFSYQTLSINWVHQSQKARQQIFPKWVQTFRVQYRSTLSGLNGNQLLVNAGLYFPGIFKNHHLVLFGSMQVRDTLRGILFPNNFPFARGYNAVNFPSALRWSANYHFPLLYPDLGIAQLFYLLRIRVNVFYDHTQGKSIRTGRIFPLRSAGGELFFDSKFWNQFPVSFGVRYTRLLDNDLISSNQNPNQFEVIVPMNIF